MRSAGIGTASLLPIMVRFILLMRPVLSSGSDSSSDSDVPVSTKMLEELPGTINLEELDLDPKHLNVDAPSHHNPPEDADVHKANTFTCTKCENIDADECILTKLGREICQLVAKDKHEKASEHFVEYLKHLDNHEEIPPSLPGDGIEVSWKSLKKFIMIFIRSQYSTNVLVHLLTKFIGTFIMSQNEDKDNTNILVQVLKKYKNLPPFRLNNIVVSEADFLVHRIPDKSEETENKKKLEDCNLREMSLLYEGGARHYCWGTENMEEVKAYNDVLATIMFYNMNMKRLEASEQKSYLTYDVASRMVTLKLIDVRQLLTKEFTSASFLKYTDLASYGDDEFIFEAFRRSAQRVIDGKCTMVVSWDLICWGDVFRNNNMIKKALDQNFQVNFENLAEYVKNMSYKYQPLNNIKYLIEQTNSIFPFKLENIIVSCSAFSKAEGPLFEKVRDANREKTGHKKLSECSLLEFKFLCQLYNLDKRIDSYQVTAENIIERLFWHNICIGNIPPAGADKFIDSSVFEKISEELNSRSIEVLFRRKLISFIDFFKAFENLGYTHVIVEPLREELNGVIKEEKEFKLLKELAVHVPETKVFEKFSYHASGLPDLVKLLEVCSKDEDVMDLLSKNLFKLQCVLYLKLERIEIYEEDKLRENSQEGSIDPASHKDGSEKVSKPEKYIADCDIHEIITIFNTHKSNNNEEVNKLLAYILLCTFDMKKPLGEDISHKVPEDFFAYASLLPPERLKGLVEAEIVPARFLTNPPK